MSLSSTFMLEIEKALTQGSFLFQDFKIKTTPDNNYIVLRITYSYIQEYQFLGYIYKSGEKYRTEITPGAVINTEIQSELSKYHFMNAINTWLYNITNELKASPYTREIYKHEETLKEFRSRIENLEGMNDHFSFEERQEVEGRLDDLERRFSEKLESDLNDQTELKDELQKMHQEIETLKLHLNALTKKNWYLSLSTRLYTWYKNHPILVRQLAGFTRELLPNEAQDVISEEALDQLLLPRDNNNNNNNK